MRSRQGLSGRVALALYLLHVLAIAAPCLLLAPAFCPCCLPACCSAFCNESQRGDS